MKSLYKLRKLILYSGIGICFLNSMPAYACSCSPGPKINLYETIIRDKSNNRDPAFGTLTILTGEILKYNKHINEEYPNSMDVKVESIIEGRLSEKIIQISGDNGMLCRPSVTQFPIGKKYIFALYNSNNLDKTPSTKNYYISLCGTYSQELTQP
ncbi:MAG: hypothetical protein JWO78_1616 [Micavibrio sp.]|nr:hypothetical protein [Micavibrio sp.]